MSLLIDLCLKIGQGLASPLSHYMCRVHKPGVLNGPWKDQDVQEGGVNWANSKFSYNNQILRIAQLTPCA